MTSKQRTRVLTIDFLQRLPLSRNGNPRFRVHFTDGTDALTSSDHGFCYGLENREYREAPVRVTFTRAGRICGVSTIQVMPDAVAFFADNAMYSHEVAKETAEQARQRNARALAVAEAVAKECAVTFTWEHDDIDSSDFSDERTTWPLYRCTAYAEDGKMIETSGGIDLDRIDGPPENETRARVVQAQLIVDHLAALTRN